MIINKLSKTIILTYLPILFLSKALADNADDRFFYIGGDFGISDPVVKKFKDKETGTKVNLKRSNMFTAKMGYSFYPSMMIELSYTHQPSYGLGLLLPANNGIPEIPVSTKVSANVITLNLIYELQKYKELTPYVIFGAGFARVSVKPTNIITIPNTNTDYFQVKKNTADCLAWQAGAGFKKDITENFSADLSVKLQVVNNIKLKTNSISLQTGRLESGPTIKKTIGVGEFTIGFNYKLPF